MALENELRTIGSRSNYQPYQRPIAPAPVKTTARTTGHHSYDSKGTTLDSNNPSVVRRNARERNRVKQVNNGFTNLRQHIPTAIIADLSNGRRGIGPGATKKLSKVDTLRMAQEYIRRLKRVIDEVDHSDASSVSSYGSSCGSSISSSPPPSIIMVNGNDGGYYHQQRQGEQQSHRYYQAVSYAGSFNHQPLQHQSSTSAQISPAASIGSSSNCSSNDAFGTPQPDFLQDGANFNGNYGNATSSATQLNFKSEQIFDDYNATASTEDEDDLLDYISLWQDE